MRESIKILGIDNMEIDTDNADSIKRMLRNYLIRKTADYNNDRRVMEKEINSLVDRVIKKGAADILADRISNIIEGPKEKRTTL